MLEKKMTRLEQLVADMESEDTTLEAAIALYRDGLALSEECAALLQKMEAEVVVLRRDAGGAFAEAAFEEAFH